MFQGGVSLLFLWVSSMMYGVVGLWFWVRYFLIFQIFQLLPCKVSVRE